MATLADLIAAARGTTQPQPAAAHDFDPNQPWNAAALQGGAAPVPAASPTPQPGPGYAVADPMALAQHLADRQQTVGRLAAPATQAVSVPLDLWTSILNLFASQAKEKE